MSRKLVLRTIIWILGIITLAIVIVQIRAKREVEQFLKKKIPSHIQLDYKMISANIFTGSVLIEELDVTVSNRKNKEIHTTVKADYFEIEGLAYWPFFFDKTIHVDNLKIGRPLIKYFRDKKSERIESDSLGVVKLLKSIIVDRFEIKDGSFYILRDEPDSLLLESHEINFTLNGFKTDPNIIKKKIPMEYGDYTFTTNNSFVDLEPFETLEIESIKVENNNLIINDIQLRSKYGKENLSNYLKQQRDHITLEIPTVHVQSLDFGFNMDKFFLISEKVTFKQPVLEMFRDKRLPDDTSQKKMYSKVINNLPIEIRVDKIALTEAYLGYEERLNNDGKPGRLFIDAIDASIVGLNTKAAVGDSTLFSAKGRLMGNATINLDYRFDLTDGNDEFLAKGKVSSLKAAELNTFLTPNLNVETEGYIEDLYFTISGDAYTSSGDIKMRYNDFRFDILRKDGKKVDKILTAIGNLFINDGDKTNDNGYRFGEISAERNVDKSFFNYLWINVKSGIASTLTGNGKKKD